jgi:membrane protease YdiL (CAAX protease family)
LTKIRLKIAALIYGLFGAVAVTWGVLRGDPDIFQHPEGLMAETFPLPAGIVLGGAAGITFGLGIARLTRFSVYRFRWARTLHTEFRGLFGPLSNVDILAYSVFSAIGEELFFRGAMQPVLGIVPASIIFGMLHFAPGRKLMPWPLQAVAMGFAFGGLFWLSGNLAAPVLAHFTINYQNLQFINSYDPSLQLPRSFASGLGTTSRRR